MNYPRLGKILLIITGVITCIFFSTTWQVNKATAQYNPYGNVLATSTPLGPFKTQKGDVLVDNFEYWDNPRNHGWMTNEPSYPIWGMGIGYGNLENIIDYAQGSRVLDVFMPYSVFLPPGSMQMAVQKAVIDPETQDLGVQAPLLWISIRAPLEVEQFATFKIDVIGNTGDTAGSGDPFCLSFVPVGFNGDTGLDSVEEEQFDLSDDENTPNRPYTIVTRIGRNFQDGSWHTLNANLLATVRKAAENGDSIDSITITGLRITGNQYRLDNIWLLQDYTPIDGEPPYLFKTGPQFIQIFQPFEYYCYAKDPDLSYRVFLDIWQNEYDLTDQDPNFSMVEELTREFIRSSSFSLKDGDAHHGHLNDPNDIDPDTDRLFWTATVGGWGSHGTGSHLISEVPIANSDTDDDGTMDYCDANIIARIPQLWIDPYKPCMVDLPTLYESGGDISEYDPETIPHLRPGTGGVRVYNPKAMAAYGRYLMKLGFNTWPQLARISYLPQVMESMFITIRVQDSHGRTDVEIFPLSVVNYPVANHPPKMENVDEQAIEVGQTYRYQMVATDQDWFNTDGSLCADQLNLTWKASIDGLSAYNYGPWSESIINPLTGAVTFTPMFEGIFHVVVQAIDSRGMMAIADFDILATQPGTWLNHRPYIMGDFNDAAPFVIKAGQMFILGPPMLDFHDPDGDELYYSCNIGSVIIEKDEDGVPRAYWTFQTNFPGPYWVQITAFDQRGGFITSEFPIDVQPYWSY